jgi:hypothetical protein
MRRGQGTATALVGYRDADRRVWRQQGRRHRVVKTVLTKAGPSAMLLHLCKVTGLRQTTNA